MWTSPLSPEQWAEARRLRAEGMAYAEIATRLGSLVSARAIASRARRERWAEPAAAGRRDAHRRRPPPAGAASGWRQVLVHHLFRILEMKLKMMELRMRKQLEDAEQGRDAAVDGDKDMRDLDTLIKTIDQVTELDPDLDRNGAAGGQQGGDPRASAADAFRREVAERIEKLVPPA